MQGLQGIRARPQLLHAVWFAVRRRRAVGLFWIGRLCVVLFEAVCFLLAGFFFPCQVLDRACAFKQSIPHSKTKHAGLEGRASCVEPQGILHLGRASCTSRPRVLFLKARHPALWRRRASCISRRGVAMHTRALGNLETSQGRNRAEARNARPARHPRAPAVASCRLVCCAAPPCCWAVLDRQALRGFV